MDDMVLDTFHLFAGAGGGLLADQLLGHRIVGAVEIEAYPRKVLLARQLDGSLPEFPIWDDVTTFRADNPDCASYIARLRALPNLCISGGFPCQDISAAGKGAGITGERSGLWSEFARIIGEIMPRYVFVENSPMLTVRGLGAVLRDLAKMGFDAEWCCLSAADCGAWHERDRIWLLASNNKYDRRGRREQFTQSNTKKIASNDSETGYAPCFEQTYKSSKQSLGIKSWGGFSSTDGIEKVVTEFCGVAYGMADRAYRISAIGNGQVPRVAATAFELLRERLEA